MGRHGVLDLEKTAAQPFEVDLDIESDFAFASSTDALEDTVDYALLSIEVQKSSKTRALPFLRHLPNESPRPCFWTRKSSL